MRLALRDSTAAPEPAAELRRPRAARRAFTIAELALTLAAMAVVSVIAIHAFFADSDVTLRGAARLLASDLRVAQASAQSHRDPVVVVFHPDGGGYHASLIARDKRVVDPRRYPIDAVFEDVRVEGVRLSRGTELSFDHHGVPSADAWITLRHRGYARTVVVEARPGTGRIRVEGEDPRP